MRLGSVDCRMNVRRPKRNAQYLAPNLATDRAHDRLAKKENDHVCIRCIHENQNLDQKELEKYWNGIRATMKGHPIEVLVAYGKHEVLEGDPIEGIVIAKFPHVKAARDWYYSEAYQSVTKHRKHRAIYHGLIVEGVS